MCTRIRVSLCVGTWGDTHVEVFIWDGKDLEVRMLADSLCDELVQGEDVWHGWRSWRSVDRSLLLRTRTEPLRVSPAMHGFNDHDATKL